MDKITSAIKICNKLVDLPYNNFSLENYKEILTRNGYEYKFINSDENLPIKLMSGNHVNAGIVTSGKGKIIMVGKGVMFDSGGLDLKPPDGTMCAMTDDKCGMMIALTLSKLFPNKVKAFCPVSTNFIFNSKIIPGNIYKIGNHQVKVTDTDAEGRLLLAEAISQLNVTKEDVVITIATLTGGCASAIGDRATAVMSDNEDLLRKYAEATYKAKELAWGLPMFEYMNNYYKKEPISNWIKEFKGSTSQGGCFIKQFVKYPQNFLHLDIAFSAFGPEGRANGVPIKSLINFIRRLI
jgi:leucyl aminopeptidase